MDKTKLGVIAFSVFCGAFFLVCAYAGALLISFDNVQAPENRALSEDGGSGYTIKSSGGEVCVFDNLDGSELAATGINIQNLRDEDKRLLEEGIEAESREELLQLLEDFKS